MLLDGRKSEIRIYWMIASLHPLVVFFCNGTVRLNAQHYDAQNFDNDLVHITNTRRQLQSLKDNGEKVNAESLEIGLKWSLDELASFIEKRSGRRRWDELMSRIKEILVRVVRSTQSALKEGAGNPDGSFQLFGADFIVDDEYNPWLTEIQTGPGLSHESNSVKKRIIPSLVREATKVASTVHRLRLTNQSLCVLQGTTDFEPLLNDACL